MMQDENFLSFFLYFYDAAYNGSLTSLSLLLKLIFIVTPCDLKGTNYAWGKPFVKKSCYKLQVLARK